jgi:hypothetical protein
MNSCPYQPHDSSTTAVLQTLVEEMPLGKGKGDVEPIKQLEQRLQQRLESLLTPVSSQSGVSPSSPLSSADLEAELFASGFTVQVLHGQIAQRKMNPPVAAAVITPTLKHDFLICTGFRAMGPCVPALFQHPVLLHDPIIVDQGFREHFMIASPTPVYKALLEVSWKA